MKRVACSVLIAAALAGPLAAAPVYRIVVLPFDKLNREPNTELETLSVGIGETLAGALSNVGNFIIIDSSRVKKYLLDNVGFNQAIGANDAPGMERLRRLAQDKLDGDYIIYGTLYRIGGQINLEAKFLKVDSGKVLRAASVHGPYPDRIFDLQEDLAKKLAGAINGAVSDRQADDMNQFIGNTQSYTAYQYYIQARVEHQKYNMKDYPGAVALYEKAIAKDGRYALAWAGLCEVNALLGYQVRYALGDHRPYLAKAIRQGEKAVELGPNLYQTHRALSLACLNNDEFDRARAVIERGYALNSLDPEILYVRASVVNYGYKEMAREGSEANRYITESLRINPELIVARWALAHSLSESGRKDEALAQYRQILSASPGHAASLHNIALIHYARKDPAGVEEYARRAIEADPDVPQYYCTRGLGRYQAGRWAEAEKWYREAIGRKTDYADAHFNLAGALYMQARYREARDEYRKVLKLKPDYPGAGEWLKKSEEMMKKG